MNELFIHHHPTDEVPPPPRPAAAVEPLAAWLDLLERVVEFRLRQALGEVPQDLSLGMKFPARSGAGPLARFIARHGLSDDDVLVLMIALSPWVRPDLFDRAVAACHAGGRDFELLGGVRGKQHRGVLPTGETVLFLLAGFDHELRLNWQDALLGDSPVVAAGLARLEPAPDDEPRMSGRFVIDADAAEMMLSGRHRAPRLSAAFPAQKLETRRHWDELVLPAQTMGRIAELRAWVEHRETLLDGWDMRGKLRPGCRALFYGPPGTGKTLTATLLGQALGREVFRIDLSLVVSKFIGETEKNLAAVFDKAEHKDWILFFDEADALYGKRSQVRDARDRYANQEVSFLLQRIEVFDGLVILASNLSNNVDAAFSRRIEHIIHFPVPKARERLELWRRSLPAAAALEPGFDLVALATEHEVSGGTISNVVRHVCLMALARRDTTLMRADFEEGIRREFAKENRLQ